VASAGGCGQRSEVLRQRLHHLAGVQDAKVPVGQQSQHPAAFGRGVVQHDGARVGDAAEGRGNHAFGPLDLGRLRPRSIFQSKPGKPLGRQSLPGATKTRLPLASSCPPMAAGSSFGAVSTTSASYSRSARSSASASGLEFVMAPWRNVVREQAFAVTRLGTEFCGQRRMRSESAAGNALTRGSVIVASLRAPPTTGESSGWAGRAGRGSGSICAHAGQAVDPSVLARERGARQCGPDLRRVESGGRWQRSNWRRRPRNIRSPMPGRLLALLVHHLGAQFEQHLGNIDLDRAHFIAGAAQRGGKGQRLRELHVHQLRCKNGADGPWIDRSVGVAAGLAIDRAGVQAGGAADALQGLPLDWAARESTSGHCPAAPHEIFAAHRPAVTPVHSEV
jgi:hypothetical protein